MDSRVRINVGGQVFETTLATVEAGGPDCILSPMLDKAWSRDRANSVSENPSASIPEIFIDRDPDLFRSLLNLLRTRHFDPPPGARLETILVEADYFGLLDAVKKAWEPPAINATNIQQVAALNRLTGSTSLTTCLAPGADGSLCVGHGSQLSTFDWTLHLQQSITTTLPQIDCIHHLSDTRVILGGSCSSDLLPIYDLRDGAKLETVSCNGSHAVVRSIASSDRFLFVASLRKTVGAEWGVGKAVAVLDKGTLQSAVGGGAAPITTRRLGGPDKVEWMGQYGLLLVLRSYEYCKHRLDESTYVRLWDPRSDSLVWEWREGAHTKRADACCDAICVPDEPYVMKLSPVTVVGRDDISFIDLRMLSGVGIGTSQMATPQCGNNSGRAVAGGDASTTWTSLKGQDPPLYTTRNRDRCHLLAVPGTKQVVASKGPNAEVWTFSGGVLESESKPEAVGEALTSPHPFRRSNVVALSGGEWIRNLAIGGERLFTTRDGSRSVEVWETRGMARLPSHLLNI